MKIESEINTYGNEFKFKQVDTTNILNIGGKKLASEGVVKESMKYTAYFFGDIGNDANMEDIYSVPIEKIKNTTRPEELRPINTLHYQMKKF